MLRSMISIVWIAVILSLINVGGSFAEWMTEGGYGDLILRPEQHTNCEIEHGPAFVDPPAGYTVSDLQNWYKNSSEIGVDHVLTVMKNGLEVNYGIVVEFVHSNWAHDPGVGVFDFTAFGRFFDYSQSTIHINMTGTNGGRVYDLTTYDGMRDLSATIAHEIGHSLGLDDGGSGVMQSPAVWGESYKFTATHDIAVANRYNIALKNACRDGWSPAFFGDVTCEFTNGVGVQLSVETLDEQNVSNLVIGRSVTPGSTDAFTTVASLSFNHPGGGFYNYTDSAGQNDSYYRLECFGNDGVVHNVAYVKEGWSEVRLDYPVGAVESMRSYNYSAMVQQGWRDIFDGQAGVPSVADTPTVPCDFLVISYKDFVGDVSPVCDYWESQGFEVTLASCDASVNDAEEVRSYIEAFNDLRPLEAVWIVGSTLPTSDWQNTLGVYDLVPTIYSRLDFNYADLDGDESIDVAVGRLPAVATREVVYYVNKELRYHLEGTIDGRKDPVNYGTTQVNIIADNKVCDCTVPFFSEGQHMLTSTGVAVGSAISQQLGGSRVSTFASTEQGLNLYLGDDDAAYQSFVHDQIVEDLEDGRHVVFGTALHNSDSDVYGCVLGADWQRQGVYLPGGAQGRPCETFWITPECFSASFYCNVRSTVDEPDVLKSRNFTVYELFLNRALMVFGSTKGAWHNVSDMVAREIAERLYKEDVNLGRPKSVGAIWKDVYNSLSSNGSASIPGLSDYYILGNPMLYVRSVYDQASDSDGGVPDLAFAVAASPNPFNGKIHFDLRGLSGGDVYVDIYDVRGRLVKSFYSPKSDGSMRVTWNGSDEEGRIAASGAYFAIARNGGQAIRNKIVYLK